MPPVTSVMDGVRALVGLALPVACAGCGRPDDQVCRGCQTELDRCRWPEGARQVRPDPCPQGLTSVHASGRYEGPLAAVVAAYKDDGRRDCGSLLGELLAASVDAAVTHSGAARELLARHNGPILAVPVPSSAASRRARGDTPLVALAGHALRGVADHELRLSEALRPVRRVADQAGLGARERAVNLEHSMGVQPRWEAAVPGAVCVVLDDVLTTGATLVEAARALRSAGAAAVLAATICATQRRRLPRPSAPGSARRGHPAGVQRTVGKP